MKVSFCEKKTKKSNSRNEDKRIKKYFQILLLVFILTSFSIILYMSNIKEEKESININSQDYVSVFNETELKKILFYSQKKEK